MLNLTAQQKALVANARARKEGKALTVKLKEQAEADRRQHLMEKRAKALQNQKHVDNKLAVHYIKKELAKYAFGDDYKKKRHRGGRASTVPLIPTRPPEAPKSERIEQALDDEIRRPPRYRAPNAWAKLYELEEQEVKLEKEQKLRASMDNKQQARLYLKRQEEEKQRQRQLEMESEMKYFERQQRDLDRHKKSNRNKSPKKKNSVK
ncbi:hypothetical protein Ae201684P_000674 [Aphanomyces euteiches]|nr:hypothetical protein Ae201684P_000674 [Aphanomyces euteiches]